MFGHIQANTNDLTPEEQSQYQAAYCGLCRALGENFGTRAKLGLTYDLTFLALLLTSLYEPNTNTGASRCMIHPCKRHPYAVNDYTRYAADITVILAYHKCLDDWNDEHDHSKKLYANLLKEKYEYVRVWRPEQCEIVEKELALLSSMEKVRFYSPDEAANCFGRIVEAIFVPKPDHWEPYLRKLGYNLGRFIYLADAAVDYDRDQKHGQYNPLVELGLQPEDLRPYLKQLLGEATNAFEMLPVVEHVKLLRNILYSGIWQKYNSAMVRRKERKTT